MTESDEELQYAIEQSQANTATAIAFLHSLLEDPDQTHRNTLMLNKLELLNLFGGMVNIVGGCIRAISAEAEISPSEVISIFGVQLLTNGKMTL